MHFKMYEKNVAEKVRPCWTENKSRHPMNERSYYWTDEDTFLAKLIGWPLILNIRCKVGRFGGMDP